MTAPYLRKCASGTMIFSMECAKAGFCDVEQFVGENQTQCNQHIRTVRRADMYTVITQRGFTITSAFAHSQKVKSEKNPVTSDEGMDPETFQKSKDGVFRVLDKLLGVPVGDTEKYAGKAA